MCTGKLSRKESHAPPLSNPVSSTSNILHQCGTFVTIVDESISVHQYYLRTIVYLSFTVGSYRSVGFDRFMSCVYHHNAVRGDFTILEITVVSATQPSDLLPNPW